MGTISRAGIVNGGLITATHITNIIDALDGTSSTTTIVATGSFSGSFSGSFKGDGSQITGVTGEWDGTLNGNASITGSLIVTAGVTASLQGTASFATSASFAISSSRASSIPLAGIGGGEVQFNDGGVLGSSNRITIASNTLTITNGGTLIATGSLLGTASYATQALSSSFALRVNAGGSNTQIQFNSGSILSGSVNLVYNYASSSIAHGNQNEAIGQYSHAEGDSNKTAASTAFSAGASGGTVSLLSSYGDVSAQFNAGDILLLYDTPFDSLYGKAYFTIDSVLFNGTVTRIILVDNTVTTTTAYVVSANYGMTNSTGNQTIPGTGAHAEGISTLAVGDYSHAEGGSVEAIGNSSHAEGTSTQAIGEGSHAEGNTTEAIGIYSHAEGFSSQAIGIYSHAEGRETEASGSYSHAEGQDTLAVGGGSHAEGYTTEAIGDYSHAEGNTTDAIGIYSHAEGQVTKAIGNASHAEGRSTIAFGDWSHAEGRDTIASGSYQTVVGQNNTHGDITSLFIVGGGLGAARLDAFKVTHSSSILIPQTQSAAPSWTGVDGEIIPATVSGTHYLYMWMNGAWRSSSFA